MNTHPPDDPTLEAYSARLQRVLRHIDEHLDDELSPGELARLAHFSRFHFQRLFRAMIGEPLGSYIRRRRLDYAAHQVRTTLTPIVTIAARVGFGSQSAFTRAFRTRFGISPARYRRVGGPASWGIPATVQFNEGGRITSPSKKEGRRAMLHVTIEDVSPIRVAAIRPPERTAIRGAMAFGAAAGRLMSWVLSGGGKVTETYAIDYGGGGSASADLFDMAPAVVLPPDTEPESWFTVHELGGGQCTIARFTGKPQALGEAYDWLYGQWLPQSGYEPDDRRGFCRNQVPLPTIDQIAAEEEDGEPDLSIPEVMEIELCVPLRRVWNI